MDTNLNTKTGKWKNKIKTYLKNSFNVFQKDIQEKQTIHYYMKRKYYLIKDLLCIVDNKCICSFDNPQEVSSVKQELLKSCSKCYKNCEDDNLIDKGFILSLNNEIAKSKNIINFAFEIDEGINLVISLIDYLPIGCAFCYYCYINNFITNKNACTKCKYAKVHGSCIDNSSDYVKMMNINYKLIKTIKNGKLVQ